MAMRLINFDIPDDQIRWGRDRPHSVNEYIGGFQDEYNSADEWHIFGWE